MSNLTVVVSGVETADQLKSICNLAPGSRDAANNLSKYITSIAGGVKAASIKALVGALAASGSLTFSSTGPTNSQTCSILNTTFTAVTSGATGNQFNISATPSTVAANLAAAINASPNLNKKVRAVAVLGVVTITALIPGEFGNGFALSAGTLSNTVASAFANGSDGEAFDLDLA